MCTFTRINLSQVVITPAMDPKDQYMVEIKSSAANALVRVEM